MNFQEPIRAEHPPGNKPIFEEWFCRNFIATGEEKREYLPVFWTSWYVNNNYGNDKKAIANLQEYLNMLDKSKKYFTVLQYDDGILNDLSGFDIKVFGSGGGRIDFPIPLICKPHPFEFALRKDTFASFIGSNSHPIRRTMTNLFRGRYKIPRGHLKIHEYCELMARSTFALAPRGYGQSSFRICEALQYGAIPVYISDHWIVPGDIDFNEYGVLIHNDEIRKLDKILKEITPEQIKSKQEAGKYYYEKMFTPEGCMKLILDNL